MSVSETTKAVLLLTSPLLQRKGKATSPILTNSEYQRLVAGLVKLDTRPEMLLQAGSDLLIEKLDHLFEPERIKLLLDRGLLLAERLESWAALGINVSSRSDVAYPEVILRRLGLKSPPLLYIHGEWRPANSRAFALLGSRHASAERLEFAQSVSESAAKSELTIVSGCAAGIDSVAIETALDARGSAIGVPSGDLASIVLRRDLAKHLRSGALILMSPFDPNMGFNVGNAMARNKVIYACADAALIIGANQNQGGTWSGAKEYLRQDYSRLYFHEESHDSATSAALTQMGAKPWQNPNLLELWSTFADQQQSNKVAEVSPQQLTLFQTSKHANQQEKETG